jgi:hypothetical protein
VSIILKSGSLKLLEPSRPVQTCTSISLHGFVKAEAKKPLERHGHRYDDNIKMGLNK